MPAVLTSGGCWHPKYMYRLDIEMRTQMQARFQCKRFGDIDNPLRLVFVDVSTTQHTILSNYSDVVSFPANLTNAVGANLATVRTQLRALGLPAKRLLTTHTWKQVIKYLINHSESLKLLHKDNVKDFIASNLNIRLIDLPQNVQNKVTNFLTNRNIDIVLTAQMDVEDLLEALSDKINVTHIIEGENY